VRHDVVGDDDGPPGEPEEAEEALVVVLLAVDQDELQPFILPEDAARVGEDELDAVREVELFQSASRELLSSGLDLYRDDVTAGLPSRRGERDRRQPAGAPDLEEAASSARRSTAYAPSARGESGHHTSSASSRIGAARRLKVRLVLPRSLAWSGHSRTLTEEDPQPVDTLLGLRGDAAPVDEWGNRAALEQATLPFAVEVPDCRPARLHRRETLALLRFERRVKLGQKGGQSLLAALAFRSAHSFISS
jgi:hypothetical protein